MAPSVLVAMTAGLLSFLSPCVLPLVPAYLAVLTGGAGEDAHDHAVIFRRALLFVAGFSLIFILLGLGASALGQYLRSYRAFLMRAGGLIVVGLGLHQVGLVRLLPLYRQRRLRMPQGGSALAALAIGMVFALGWTPCVGPVLAAILALAGTGGRILHGAGLLLAYSVGLGAPFLHAALGYERLAERIQGVGRMTR